MGTDTSVSGRAWLVTRREQESDTATGSLRAQLQPRAARYVPGAVMRAWLTASAREASLAWACRLLGGLAVAVVMLPVIAAWTVPGHLRSWDEPAGTAVSSCRAGRPRAIDGYVPGGTLSRGEVKGTHHLVSVLIASRAPSRSISGFICLIRCCPRITSEAIAMCWLEGRTARPRRSPRGPGPGGGG